MTTWFKDNPKHWTIAFRKRRANRFQRVTDWVGTWHEAVEMAGRCAELFPELQVYYTTNAEAEEHFSETHLEDKGNIMVDSGRRVRVVDNATLPAELRS